jgi:hypothetical protein
MGFGNRRVTAMDESSRNRPSLAETIPPRAPKLRGSALCPAVSVHTNAFIQRLNLQYCGLTQYTSGFA